MLIGRGLHAGLVVVALCTFACGGHKPEVHTADAASKRTTRQGDVVGFVGEYGSDVWLGIPFAKPPVGDLRWRAPQAPEPWAGVRDAVAAGSPCPQYAGIFAGVNRGKPGEPVGSEDCLYLNVYAPRFPGNQVPSGTARLPVMVWIHGGGNTIGEAAFYNGGNLAVTHKVVVVAINYRLGPFGWFRNAALRGDGTNELDQSGNFGTLDLIRALEWVQENAAAFGGDPNNVTIFGESAGGTNVYSLLLSPKARGLFQRAVVESGGFFFRPTGEAENFADASEPGDPSSSNEAVLRLLMKDGATDRTAAKAKLTSMSTADAARYLRGKSTVDILGAYTPQPGAGMISMPLVFRDGVVLPSGDPVEQFARADTYNAVPVILGTNRDENKLFMMNDPKWVNRYLWVFYRVRDENHYNRSAEYLAKWWKATGVDESATAMRAAQGPTVFAYRFDWDEEPSILGSDFSMLLGAAHAFEIPFVFGHFDLGARASAMFTKDNEPGRKALSAQMMSYWAEFAYKGSPGRGRGSDLPEWSAWNNEDVATPKFMVLDSPAGGGARMSNESLTRAKVLAAVDGDPRLPTQRDKCLIYHDLAERSRGFTKADYVTAGSKGCKEFPFDTYPWAG